MRISDWSSDGALPICAFEALQRRRVQPAFAFGKARPRPRGQRVVPLASGRGPRRSKHAVEVGGRNRVAGRQRGQPPAQVLQLAHVAGPVVVLQALERGLAEAIWGRTEKNGRCPPEAFGKLRPGAEGGEE